MPALADFHLSIQMASEGILLSLGGGGGVEVLSLFRLKMRLYMTGKQ